MEYNSVGCTYLLTFIIEKNISYSWLCSEAGKTKEKKKARIKRLSSVDDVKEYCTTDPLKVKPVVASQKEVIDYIRKNPSCGFLYMIYAVNPQNVYFTPYYLK